MSEVPLDAATIRVLDALGLLARHPSLTPREVLELYDLEIPDRAAEERARATSPRKYDDDTAPA